MRRTVAALAAVLAVGLLTGADGCESATVDAGDAQEVSNPLDNPKTATCQDWLDATQDQRDEAALRFVKVLKAYDQSAEFAHTFAVNISKDCDAGPSLGLPEVVGALATLDTEDFPR